MKKILFILFLLCSTFVKSQEYTPRIEQLHYQLESLEVDVEAVTVNGGVPFVASGVIANSKSVVVGTLTTGPELIMLSRVFKV